MPPVEGRVRRRRYRRHPPLRTAREPFVIHAAQASRYAHVLFDGTRFLNKDMLVVNLLVAVGMEYYSVFINVRTTEGMVKDMVVVPSGYLGDFLLADRTDTVLLFPKAEQLSSTS